MTDYVSLFGKGSAEELAKSQPDAFRNREKAYAMMAILRRGYEASGEQVPPDSELIKSAVQAAFHEKTQKIARNSIKNQIKNAGSQALSRPRSGGKSPSQVRPRHWLSKRRSGRSIPDLVPSS
jgi:hypothetical protein